MNFECIYTFFFILFQEYYTILLLLGEDYYGLSIHCYLLLVCLKAKAFMYRITGTTCCIQSNDNTISTKKT